MGPFFLSGPDDDVIEGPVNWRNLAAARAGRTDPAAAPRYPLVLESVARTWVESART
jgi:hypothetical protein